MASRAARAPFVAPVRRLAARRARRVRRFDRARPPQEDEPSAFVKYERFEPKMLEILAEGDWEPDSEEVLLQAFRVFDEDGKGYIEANRLREALITKTAARSYAAATSLLG